MSKALLCAVLLSGCSIALQSKPAKPGHAAKECSTSRAYWIADAVGVAAGVVAVTYSIANGGSNDNLIGGPGAIGGVLYLASMGNGIKWRNACERGEPAHVDPRYAAR